MSTAVQDKPTQEAGSSDDRRQWFWFHFVLYLSPVLLLSLAFPLVNSHIAAQNVGGLSLSALVLAGSVTVPWIAQAACLPAYRALGPIMARRKPVEITRTFSAHWPAMFVASLPLAVIATALLTWAQSWRAESVGVYFVLMVAHLLFVQSLVVGNVLQRRGVWALGWGAYALALVVAPTVWWLPPVAGALTQLIMMGRHVAAAREFARLPLRPLLTDLGRGLLLGSVLWADKFVIYFVYGLTMPVTTIFGALLPAVIAYNYYFVRRAPAVDAAVADLHKAIEHAPMAETQRLSDAVHASVRSAVRSTGLVGVLLGGFVVLAFAVIQPAQLGLALVMTTASLVFMMLTLISYKLDYIGDKARAARIGAVHLVATLSFLVLPLGAAYGVLLLVDVVLLVVAYGAAKRQWSQPQYTLFWQHATRW